MRFLHGIFALLMFCLLMCLGMFLISQYILGPELWDRLIQILQDERFTSPFLGVAIILLLLLYLLTKVPPRNRGKYLSFASEAGPISISKTAVREMIKKVGDEFAAVLSIQPSLVPRRNNCDVEVDLRVRSGTQVPELCRMLQDRIRETLNENMGISGIRQIKVNVREIVSPSGDRPTETNGTI